MKFTVVFGMLLMPWTIFASNCWKHSYGRGVGQVITACREGQEKNGALCYPLCEEGFYGVGPVCWQSCPNGFRDDGAFCYKPPAYGRGGGYAIWNEEKCKRDWPDQGCEKWGAMWYPKCLEHFHNFACCICSPDCPSGMTDIGISCAKQSYGRGVGEPLTCETGLEMSGLLCYSPCKAGYYGIGPVCWQKCPAGKTDCGALCTEGACTDILKSISNNAFGIIAAAATLNGDQLTESFKGITNDLVYGICEHRHIEL